jgi:hypothetical protein
MPYLIPIPLPFLPALGLAYQPEAADSSPFVHPSLWFLSMHYKQLEIAFLESH